MVIHDDYWGKSLLPIKRMKWESVAKNYSKVFFPEEKSLHNHYQTL